MLPWLATAFLTGLISSLHCVGMCGPLVAALPVGRLSPVKRWRAVALYHTGRIATYSLLGALAGTMSLGLYLIGWQKPLAVMLGIVLLVSFLWNKALPARLRWPWLNNLVTLRFRETLKKPSLISFLVLGILNGLLPCGFTYLALAGTLATNTPLMGVTYMFLFGIGTLPGLLGINLLTAWLGTFGRRRLNQVISGVTVVVAILLIVRGFATYSLPISPADVIPMCRAMIVGK